MPFLHEPKSREPLWKEWNYLAQKRGIRHTIYSVDGNEYTGEWLDNLKHGEFLIFINLRMFSWLFLGHYYLL